MPAHPDALTIRRAAAADAAPLAELALRSFLDAYAALNDPDDIAAYTARVYGATQQAAEIADRAITTLVGEVEGRMVAYAQLRWLAPGPGVTGPTPIEVMRFYVDQPWHGRGVAHRMMDAALATARARSGWPCGSATPARWPFTPGAASAPWAHRASGWAATTSTTTS